MIKNCFSLEEENDQKILKKRCRQKLHMKNRAYGVLLMNKKIIVFAPHPDDGVLGCGGTIAKGISEGYDVMMVVITDGRYAFSNVLGIDSDPSPDEMKEIRMEEVKKAIRMLGMREQQLLFLNFEDRSLEKKEREVQEKILKILKENHPTEVYFPCEKEYHKDHIVTNRILKNSCKKLSLNATQYKYTITQRYARIGPLIDRFLNFFKRNMVSVDISRFLHLKEEAVKEFRSKISILSVRQKRPITLNFEKFLNKKERFYIDR